MNITRLFILRPVATLLLSFAVIALGTVAWKQLPVASLPQMSFPVIVVTASMPGASPKTMAASVTAPLERSLGGIAGVERMTSRSSRGSAMIFIVFDMDRDINAAARDVQAAISAAADLLPSAMPSLPSYSKADPSDAPIVMLSLTSTKQSPAALYDLAVSRLVPLASQVKGVGEVQVMGGSLPAIRVSLQPDLLANAGVSLNQVRQVIADASQRRPLGRLDGTHLSWLVSANDQLETAADYRQLVVKQANGQQIRLGDVAHVSASVENIYTAGYYNGQRGIMLGIIQANDANMLATIDAVKALLPAMRRQLPEGTQLKLAVDRSNSVRDALYATEETLLVAVVLVILVVFVFLRSGRATLIPALALPISLIGACGIMYWCGFSLNNLTLMALIIATGFVVDDAIVVLENISRHLEAGEKPLTAALQGAREVTFTVISMTLTLIAVFLPMLLMGGIAGQLFREFSVTLAAAMLISMVVSLSLTPMLCARVLRPHSSQRQGRLLSEIGRGIERLRDAYLVVLRQAVRHRFITLMLLLLTIVGNGYLFVHIDKGFFPQQDTGLLYGRMSGDETSSFEATRQQLLKVAARIRQEPGVAAVMASVGGGRWGSRDSGQLFIKLNDYDQRDRTADEIANAITNQFKSLPGYRVYLRPADHLPSGGHRGDSSYAFSLQADDLELLRHWTMKTEAAFKKLPELTSVNSNLGWNDGQELELVIDRQAAARLGVSVADITNLLGNAFGQRQVGTIYQPLNQYHVIMTLAPQWLKDPSSLRKLYLIGGDGSRVPLLSVAKVVPGTAPTSVSHQDQMASYTLSFNLADGVAMSEARDAIDATLTRIGLPRDKIKAAMAGNASLFGDFVSSIPWLFLAALLVVYVVLGVLYESYIHPLTILSTLPSAGVGALLLLILCQVPFTVIVLIGILLLIGIVMKNAIMMIDFALVAERQQGMTPEAAILEACRVRFRPILMTTCAAFFGALPLAIGTGADPSLRQPLGLAIMGGLALSQLLTLFTTPVVYLYLDRLARWIKMRWVKGCAAVGMMRRKQTTEAAR